MALTELDAEFLYRGARHRVKYGVGRGVYAVEHGGLVYCESDYQPISVDGLEWTSKECQRDLFLQFARVEQDASLNQPSKDPAFENIAVRPVPDAKPRLFRMKVLECGDEQMFLPLTNTIGYYYFPLVFNNACASYGEVAGEFIRDASFYIGTARPVDSFKAVEVVRKFVKHLGDMPVAKALFEAQRGFIGEYTPYLLAGVPWLSMPHYASRAVAIMRANGLLKRLRTSPSGGGRADSRRIFQEQQRQALLRQLFEHGTKGEAPQTTPG